MAGFLQDAPQSQEEGNPVLHFAEKIDMVESTIMSLIRDFLPPLKAEDKSLLVLVRNFRSRNGHREREKNVYRLKKLLTAGAWEEATKASPEERLENAKRAASLASGPSSEAGRKWNIKVEVPPSCFSLIFTVKQWNLETISH